MQEVVTPSDERVRPLQHAIVNRIARALSADISADDVNLDAPLFEEGLVRIGAHEFDSLELAEAVITLEDDLGISFLDAATIDDAPLSVTSLSLFVLAEAEPPTVEGFIQRWG